LKLPKDFDVDALCQAAYRARLALRYPREVRVFAVRQRAGFYYSTDAAKQPQPINMLEMIHTIVGGRLVSNNPQVNLTTDIQEAKPVATAMMEWVNKQIQRIRLVETLQRATEDSIDWYGCVMVSLASPGTAAMTGWNIKAGEPFAEVVDPDDHVWDLHARRMDQPAWEGHRFRIPLRVAQKMYGKTRSGKEMEGDDDRIYNLEGDEKISMISRTTLLGEDEIEPMIDLWHFYIARERLCIILRDEDLSGSVSKDRGGKNSGRVLDAYPWVGPDHGPYHHFVLKTLPGNSVPKGMIQDCLDLNESINILARKLMLQGDRQKEVIFAHNSASKDAKQLSTANDGEIIYTDRPDDLKAVFWGGPNQQNFQLLNALIDRLSWLVGNLELLGGLGAQSPTAKQDELLNENSSATTQNYQQRTMNGIASVTRALCWYWYHDPYKVMSVTYAVPGSPNVTAPLQLHPHPQEGEEVDEKKMYRNWKFEDLNIHIDPYTVQYQSPQQRQAAIDSVVKEILLPAGAIMQANGVQFDFRAYLEKKAKMQDMPDLMDLVRMARTQIQGSSEEQQQPDLGSMKPATTSREYTRRSEPGTNAGRQEQYGAHMDGPRGVQKAG